MNIHKRNYHNQKTEIDINPKIHIEFMIMCAFFYQKIQSQNLKDIDMLSDETYEIN